MSELFNVIINVTHFCTSYTYFRFSVAVAVCLLKFSHDDNSCFRKCDSLFEPNSNRF